MNRLITFLVLIFCFSFGSVQAQTWELVWSDEFDGSALDLDKWSFQMGDGCPSLCGWGNNELQWYTDTNHTVANGVLTIEARAEPTGTKNYSSTRIRSINKGDWTYGRFESRAKLPTGKGLWPALWMLPTDPSIYGVWAASGEIDIMEMVGDKPEEVLGSIHFGGSWPENQFTTNEFVLDSGTFNDDFHVFAAEWEEGVIRWYVDDQLYASVNNWSSSGGNFPAPFDVDFHLLMNVAVGGNLPGNPDASTSFPQTMVIDYVRVYEDVSGGTSTGDALIFDDMEHGDPDNNFWFTFDGAGGGISANTNSVPPSNGGSASITATYPSANGYIGGFGRTNRMNLADATNFDFWINPMAGQSYTLEMQLQDDDNGDDLIPTPSSDDDEFQFNCVISDAGPCAIAGGGWQLVSIPFSDFVDDNSFHNGGNAILDPVPVSEGGNGQLVNVVVTVVGNNTGVNFDTDYWIFRDSTQAMELSGEDALPNNHKITAAYPNPFSDVAQFSLSIEQAQHVTVEVFDALGRRMDLIHDGFITGFEEVTFRIDGSNWPSGIYFYNITGESFTSSRRIVLTR